MFEQPHELRELANWYRDLAQFGDEPDRNWHLTLVDFLEERAAEIEELGSTRPVAAPDYCYPQGLLAAANN